MRGVRKVTEVGGGGGREGERGGEGEARQTFHPPNYSLTWDACENICAEMQFLEARPRLIKVR